MTRVMIRHEAIRAGYNIIFIDPEKPFVMGVEVRFESVLEKLIQYYRFKRFLKKVKPAGIAVLIRPVILYKDEYL